MNKIIRLAARVLKAIFGEGFYRRTDVAGHTLEAWMAAARYGFPGRRLHVIGVTGTNGKTTTVQYISSVLGQAGYCVGASTTIHFRLGEKQWENDRNQTVTNPWHLQRLLRDMRKAGVDWAVLEVTSHALHQNRVGGVKFDMGVMTNLSPDHLDYHGTRDVGSYAASKAKLFKKARQAAVLNRDDEWYDYYHGVCGCASYSYGWSEEADVRIDQCRQKPDGAKIRLRYGERVVHTRLHMPGKFNVYNALAAAAVAFGLEIDWEQMRDGLENVAGMPGRMEPLRAGQDFGVVIDYAHTPAAFSNVFEALRSTTEGQIIAVFGGAPTHDYGGLGRTAGEHADLAIITDDEPMDADPDAIRSEVAKAAQDAGHARVREVPDRYEALAEAFAAAGPGDTVAILGLGHQMYRRIDGNRIEWNDREVAEGLLRAHS